MPQLKINIMLYIDYNIHKTPRVKRYVKYGRVTDALRSCSILEFY